MVAKRPLEPNHPRRRKQPLAGDTGVIWEPPAARRSKSTRLTQTPRTKDTTNAPGFRAQPPALRAVQRRGSAHGRYTPETQAGSEENVLFDFPQIDPTATTNPARPRTLQAGYYRDRDESTGVLRVRFRDGTPWEYHDVPPNVWRNFRRVKSPGRFINRVLNNYPYGRGDF